MAEIDPEEREAALEDLEDLEAMRAVFDPRGYKGVVIVCSECGEDHYYGWDMLKESLEHMLEAGEPRVHEPAFEPHPDDYIGWDYGRGYIDSLTESEGDEMEPPPDEERPSAPTWLGDRSRCAWCRGKLPSRALGEWTYCPYCGANLASLRLVDALSGRGWAERDVADLMDEAGFESPPAPGEEG
ncbi:MAG: DUF5319 family protein [Acidobacteria bacterium]|nr:DUF5319 family protein [Acidobacteriota bacterium]